MSEPPRRNSAPALLLTGAACALLLLTALFVNAEGSGAAGSPGGTAADTVSEETRAAVEELARRDPADPHAMGAADAPVVLIVYSDYLCPFCADWVRRTQPELVEAYVDPGLVRIEWREFPYLGEASRLLARGAVAAGNQDRFWEYHARVYAAPEDFTGGADEVRASMRDAAGEIGLDTDAFARDLDSAETGTAVERDFTEGQDMGMSGTPAFLVNGDPVLGAQPLEAFTDSVDAALRAAGR
ncbi:thioredoxin domain-containing protein [Nocardiopsis akebiae]|uniref:Thioredoxin domain-containing protein n=1 Tax=Nocardiopsis akebiae TaxID=2831968 RepID=A0ABX8C4A4_9ACTN|nr:thioredoxin domain-containing protein [Nocardiopsis akebiae]QUX27413.1 thioredoxin domain-containing protein [Nocardiopsis akebiae]